MPQFAGEFETHLTIICSRDQIANLELVAFALNAKFVHILLDAGQSPSQPMLTLHGFGTLSEQVSAADRVHRKLVNLGFTVSRIKIEASPTNSGIPQTDAEASIDHTLHFEHHIKVLLPASADLNQLRTAVEQAGGHVSKNARRQRDDGQIERFITQRCYSIGEPAALARLQHLVVMIQIAGYQILEIEKEYVVYDSHPQLDHGWI